MKSFLIITAACLALATGACGSAPQNGDTKAADSAQASEPSDAVRLKPGMWEAVGGTAAQLAAAGAEIPKRCVSAEEAKTANGSDSDIKAAFEAQMKKDGCTLASLNIEASTITIEQICSGAKLKTVNTYDGDNSTTVITGGGMPEMKTESRRVGDC